MESRNDVIKESVYIMKISMDLKIVLRVMRNLLSTIIRENIILRGNEGMDINNRKVVVISGSGRGIGKAIAFAFAKNGYKVCIFSRSEDECRDTVKEIKNSGGIANYWIADVKKHFEIENIYNEIFERYGRIDVAINNAAVIGRDSFYNQSFDDIEKMVDINLKGTLNCCKAAAKNMRKNKSGSIINVASVGAFIGLSERVVYGATKGAIVSLTKSLAVELSNDNITVNAIAPGAVRTPFNKKWFSDHPKLVQELKERIPLGRLAEISDIVEPVIFLASPSARYITGHTLVVDGGWTIS